LEYGWLGSAGVARQRTSHPRGIIILDVVVNPTSHRVVITFNIIAQHIQMPSPMYVSIGRRRHKHAKPQSWLASYGGCWSKEGRHFDPSTEQICGVEDNLYSVQAVQQLSQQEKGYSICIIRHPFHDFWNSISERWPVEGIGLVH
jgi:hypothetical protein